MDYDTTRVKSGYDTIIEQFKTGVTDIPVGTQMVTKGLDFDKVSLVGVFNADRMMHFPDFRSYERAFQLITQVSGRAGRREKPGKVVIQTSHVDHPVLNFILNHTQEEFYKTEIVDRREHAYPPFSRLIEVNVRHIDKKISRDASLKLADQLKQAIPEIKVLGPGEPMVQHVYCEILPCTTSIARIREMTPSAVILSGGPASVFEEGAPSVDKGVFGLGVPVLGICYGMQLTAHLLGRKVEPAGERDYGPAQIEVDKNASILASFSAGEKVDVWASHGDKVVSLPEGFEIIASSPNAPFATCANEARPIYGVQFHPEVVHTPRGADILRGFLFKVSKLKSI